MRQLPQTNKRNSPDKITLGTEDHYWNDLDSYGFILNKNTENVIMSLPGESHSDMIEYGDEWKLNKAGLTDIRFDEIKFCDWLDYSDEESLCKFNEWYSINKQKADSFLCGRAWVINDSVRGDRDGNIIVVSWWNEITNDDFKRLNDKIVEELASELDIHNIVDYRAVDNNGDLIELSLLDDECPYIEKCHSLDDLYKISAIHLASQKEKRERLSDFRVYRDELFQKIWESDERNLSKTEAEWRCRRYSGD